VTPAGPVRARLLEMAAAAAETHRRAMVPAGTRFSAAPARAAPRCAVLAMEEKNSIRRGDFSERMACQQSLSAQPAAHAGN
jgi:hypothetical protein